MIYDSLLNFMLDYCRHLHTIKPALVTKVDLTKNVLSAKILTSTLYKDGDTSNFPDVVDVPFMVLAGNKGLARVTVPVTAGDNVIILYSDRELGTLASSKGSSVQKPSEIKTHGYYPVMALPDFFTESNAKPIEPNKVVIENGVTSIKMDALGNVEVIAPTTTTITTASMIVNCPLTTFNGVIATGGIIPLPGAANVPMTGDFAMSGNMAVTGSLTINGVVFSTHRHSPSNTGPSNP